MQQWIDGLPSSNNYGADVGHGRESNGVSLGTQPVVPIANFANDTGRPLAPASVNTGGQLVSQVPGLTYNIGPPQRPPPAVVLRPIPDNREPADEYGKGPHCTRSYFTCVRHPLNNHEWLTSFV